jgi:hypothetical protein
MDTGSTDDTVDVIKNEGDGDNENGQRQWRHL